MWEARFDLQGLRGFLSFYLKVVGGYSHATRVSGS
jgi:hypothetical protein